MIYETLAILIFIGCSKDSFIRGQTETNEIASTPSDEERISSRGVNLFVITDDDNKVVNLSVTAALKTLKEKYPKSLSNVWIVQVNESEPDETLNRICNTWESAVNLGGRHVPDLAFDVTTAGLSSEVSNAFTAAMGIPTLSAQYGQEGDIRSWRNLNPDKAQYLIQIMPPADLVPEAIRQLVIDLDVTNAAILFDDDFVMDHKYKSLLLNVATRHVINEAAQSVSEMRNQLSRLRDLDVVNYFILGDENTMNVALDAAESLNFTGQKYGWFALTLYDFIPGCECRNMSLLFMKPEDPKGRLKANSAITAMLPQPILSSGFYYDLTLLAVQTMKRALDNGDWPLEPEHINCETYEADEATNTPERDFNFLNKLKTTYKDITPTYAGIEWGKSNGQHSADFEMSINMVRIENRKSTMVNSGSWTAGVDQSLQVMNDNIRNNTAITSYRVVTVIHPPFVMYDETKNEWSGFCIDLLNEIRNTITGHFEYEIREVEDREYGALSPDGSWNGTIKELVEKRADIALGSLWVMAEREKVVDFTVPFYDLVGLSIMMLKAKTSTSLFKFLTVLENEVWFCILGAYFFTSLLMWVFDRWSPYSYQNNREKYRNDDEKREFTLRECFWFCMTSLTPQGGGEAPKNLSGRLVAATWWLFGFIIIASYTANLAAFLTVSRLEIPVESLEDLSKQYKIQYAPVRNSPAHHYFERMANIETRFYEIWKDMSLNDSLSDVERAKLAVWDYPVSDRYTKMFQAMKEAGFPETIEEALQRVRRENSSNEFAFIGDASTIKYLVMTNCDLTQVGDEFSRKPYAIAVQQGSPLKDQFNNAILILLNKRKLEKIKDVWWKNNPKKRNCELEDDQTDGISIHNIGGVFVVIFVGIIFACFTLAFEYWYYRHRVRVNDTKQVTSPNMKNAKIVKPMRFNLQPAPTHGFQAFQFRSRF